jgi:hypothetical protein
MLRNSVLSFIIIISVSTFVWAQKPKASAPKKTVTSNALSNAEKMGYARTNQYWGPGTYYSFAPGVTHMKMVNNSESAMRDLTGISKEDCLAELAKQGFTEVPPKEVERWFNPNKSKDIKYFYAPDKSYILYPGFKDLYESDKNGVRPYAAGDMVRYKLLPIEDSLKVMEMAWQYLRDINSMKLLLGSFNSTFKKANPKAYPIEQSGSTGWNSMRAGTFVLRMIDGKPQGAWERNEDIVRRTIGKPDFRLLITAVEIDFEYMLQVKLQKEGYVLRYEVVAVTLKTLEPGANWADEHKQRALSFNGGETMDKQAIELYKKAPLPPVLEDLNHLLHIQ